MGFPYTKRFLSFISRQCGSTELKMSDSDFLSRLHRATPSSFDELDRLYRNRLCALVQRQFNPKYARREDPEDIAQSVFRTFFRGIDEKRFYLDHSTSIWKLLATLTRRKVLKHVERHTAAKCNPANEVDSPVDLSHSREPGPEDVATFLDSLEQLSKKLASPGPEILGLMLQGYKQVDIAKELGCSESMVKRTIKKIREQFSRIF